MRRMPTPRVLPTPCMPLRLVFALLMLCIAAIAHAQNVVEGTVTTDSLSPNTHCTITLYDKDGKQWQALACDEHGKFRVENVPTGTIRVEAKAIGHVTQSKKAFLFGNTKMQMDFELKAEAINLKEVEVKSSPMIVNGDTTTYIVSRFTTGREKVLKDVVNNLPGVRYDEKDNSLTVNGKRVSKVLVQGEDLYQGNVSTPMENLPASGVDNFKVIDNYSEYNVFSGFKQPNGGGSLDEQKHARPHQGTSRSSGRTAQQGQGQRFGHDFGQENDGKPHRRCQQHWRKSDETHRHREHQRWVWRTVFGR